jgi:2-keto-3-deoxy-L-rhamnonate aldolase RhmA
MTFVGSIRRNRLKDAIAAGRQANGYHMSFGSPYVIETLGNLNFDLVYLDAEHGSFTLSEIENCCRAAELSGITVIARTPSTDRHFISQLLNTGVQGLIVPHVESADDVKRVMDSAFMEPRGHRPNGKARSNGYWSDNRDLSDLISDINDAITISIQIESIEAVQSIDEILAVGGVDYYTIGKNDLSQSMGFRRLPNGFHREVTDVVNDVEKKLRAAGQLLKDDVMRLIRVEDMMLTSCRQFLDSDSS